jgi:hypothetical protein
MVIFDAFLAQVSDDSPLSCPYADSENLVNRCQLILFGQIMALP